MLFRSHLLLGCVVARDIWDWTIRRWGRLGWVPEVDSDLLQWWTSLDWRVADRRDLWTVVLLVFWCIWRHRNDVVFNGATPAGDPE